MRPRTRHANDTYPRRAVLRACAGALTAGLLPAVTGCVSSLPPVGPAQHFGRIDVPSAASPRYRRWLPAPETIEGLETDQYGFLFRQPSALDYPAPIRFVVPRKRLLADLDYFGIGYANYDALLHSDLGTVIEAAFDPRVVAQTLTQSGYTPAGSYQGYDLFERTDVHRRAAVDDGAIVWTSDRIHNYPSVEALIDARAGRITRYHETSDGFRRLSEVVGESRMVELIPPKEGARDWTSCEGFRFDGTTAYHVRAFLYPTETALPEQELRERSIDGTVLTREVENTDLRIDDRLAVFEGRIPPGEGVSPATVDPPYPPQITWGVTYVPDERITIRHAAGDSVPAGALTLSFGCEHDAPLSVRSTERRLFPEGTTVSPGDTATIELDGPPTVRVRDPTDAADETTDTAGETEDSRWQSREATYGEVSFAPGSVGYPLFRFSLTQGGIE